MELSMFLTFQCFAFYKVYINRMWCPVHIGLQHLADRRFPHPEITADKNIPRVTSGVATQKGVGQTQTQVETHSTFSQQRLQRSESVSIVYNESRISSQKEIFMTFNYHPNLSHGTHGKEIVSKSLFWNSPSVSSQVSNSGGETSLTFNTTFFSLLESRMAYEHSWGEHNTMQLVPYFK